MPAQPQVCKLASLLTNKALFLSDEVSHLILFCSLGHSSAHLQLQIIGRRDRIPVYLGRVVITWTVDYLAVQHLIEKCLIFHMTKEECMEALSKHANIKPVITSTVWNELEKENKEFFEAYSKAKSSEDRMSEAETSQMIQKMISESGSSTGSND